MARLNKARLKAQVKENTRKRKNFRINRILEEHKSYKKASIWMIVICASILIGNKLTRGAILSDKDFPVVWFSGLLSICCIVGAALNTYYQRRVRSWPSVSCRIEVKDVIPMPNGGPGVAYQGVVHYNYKVDGTEYFSDRIGYGVAGTSIRAASESIARYTEGGMATCYYNPADPSKAVLDLRFRYPVPIFFAVIGVGLAVFAVWIQGQTA